MNKGDLVRVTARGMYCEQYLAEYIGILGIPGSQEPLRHLLRFTEPNEEGAEYECLAADQFEVVEEALVLGKFWKPASSEDWPDEVS